MSSRRYGESDADDIVFEPDQFTISHIVNREIHIKFQDEMMTLLDNGTHYEASFHGVVFKFNKDIKENPGSIVTTNLISIVHDYTNDTPFNRKIKEGTILLDLEIAGERIRYMKYGGFLLKLQVGADGTYVEIPNSDLIYVLAENNDDHTFFTIQFLPKPEVKVEA